MGVNVDLGDRFTCPVCGYPGLFERAYSARTGLGSYEICPSCGFEFGVSDDDQGFTHEQWRVRWIAEGMPWWSEARHRPVDWDPAAQLRRVAA